MLYRFQPDYEQRRALTIERADSRDRGPSTGNKGNSGGGKGTAGGNGQPQGQRPMQIDPLGQVGPVPQNSQNPFTTGGGFNLHQKTPGGSQAGTPGAPPAGVPGVDPSVIQQQGNRVVLDPSTAQPIGTPDPYGPAMLGGPMGASVTQEALNSQQAIGMARAGLAPAGSEALGNALNARGYYNDAMRKQNESGIGGWLARNASLMGFEQAPVNLDQPQSYAGGSPQLGLNPPGLFGGIVGGFAGFPGLGTAAGAAYSAFGGKDAILSGPQAYSPYSGEPVNSQPSNLPSGFKATGGSIPSSTPSATVGSPASQPLQSSPAAQSQGQGQSGFSASGQQNQGGRTVISGANTVAWPWNSINS